MKKYVQPVHEQIKNLEIIEKEEEIIAKTGDLTDRIDSEGQEDTDEDQTDDEEKNSPPRISQKSNDQNKTEVDIHPEVEEDRIEDDMLTDKLEERTENLFKVKPATEPSLADCLAVIDNLQKENFI